MFYPMQQAVPNAAIVGACCGGAPGAVPAVVPPWGLAGANPYGAYGMMPSPYYGGGGGYGAPAYNGYAHPNPGNYPGPVSWPYPPNIYNYSWPWAQYTDPSMVYAAMMGQRWM